MLKNEVIKDIYNRSVFIGGKCAVLVKRYGFRGIDRAYLMRGTYMGKGQYGYEFIVTNGNGYKSTIRMREPQVVKH